MNFYGPESLDRHTIAGRVLPLLEAFDIAIKKAAKLPVPEQKRSAELPHWCHRICDQLTKTLFKNVVGFAPQDKLDPRKIGRCVGMLIRGATFSCNEAAGELKREGLIDLSQEQKKKLEKAVGWPVVFREASERWQEPIQNKRQLIKVGRRKSYSFVSKIAGHICKVLKYLLNRSVREKFEFLSGIPEGFVAVLNDDGDFAVRTKRNELYLSLLMHWPEILEMQNTQSPTRRVLLEWLEMQEKKQLVVDQKQFNELCADVELDLAPPGRPPKAGSE